MPHQTSPKPSFMKFGKKKVNYDKLATIDHPMKRSKDLHRTITTINFHLRQKTERKGTDGSYF